MAGRRERVGYTIADTRLGTVAVAATPAGVRAIVFGEAPSLPDALAADLPDAELVRDDGALEAVVDSVRAAIDGAPAHELPLDMRGSLFQRSVWEALLSVPVGTTATYSDVAAAIGRPQAVRAVANACGANHIAVLVPCHRVVRTDGGLGGYKWGVERKRALLDAEAARKD